MRKKLLIAFVASLGVVTALAIAPTKFEPVERTNAENNCIDSACSNHSGKPTPCPEGSYSIGIEKNGENICKLEPTGCPYGDSIPLDICDKFKPVDEGKNDTTNDSRSTEGKKEQSSCSTSSK